MDFHIRNMKLPDDYEAVAEILTVVDSEPVTAQELQTEEENIPPGELSYNEQGELTGWDRRKWVADMNGRVVGYAIAWRAPWMEPGLLYHTIAVLPEVRGNGIGQTLFASLTQWAREVKASKLVVEIMDTDEYSLAFAKKRGYELERHTFESVLELGDFDRPDLTATIEQAEQSGITFVTLADEPGEASERKLYELYKVTHQDIPGSQSEFPWFEEWRKWSIDLPGAKPEWIHIAKDGDAYIGVVA